VKLFVDLTPDERRSYQGWLSIYQEPLAEFRRLHPGASWESFLRWAARSEKGRRAIAAWSRARRLLACPRGKRDLLGSLLERHRDSRVMVFVSDNETAYRVAREFLMCHHLTFAAGRVSVSDSGRDRSKPSSPRAS
jgi:superfamily II DNA or RNA helicase